METAVNYIIENKLIVLNSKDADKLNAELLSDVNFKFKDILKAEENILYVSCSLLSAEIPCSFYNININNQLLIYTINGVEYSLIVQEGNYNATSFITEIVSQFNSDTHGHSINMTFNKITGKLTITKLTGAFDIIIQSSGSSMYEVLGLLTDNDYTITTTLVCPYMLNLLGVKKLKIFTNSISLANYDSNGHTSGSLLHTISVDVPSYSLLVYQNNHLALTRVMNKTINEIHIQIRDENHKLIDFNNVYWNLTIVLNIYRKFIPQSSPNLNLNDLAIQNQMPPEITPLPTKKELKVIMNKLDKQNLEELELLLL